MSYTGPERRKDRIDDLANIHLVLTSIQMNGVELKTKLENLHNKVNQTNQNLEERIDKHEETIYGNGKPGLTTKIDKIVSISNSFDSHVIMDKWMFGTVITLLVVIIGKLIVGG